MKLYELLENRQLFEEYKTLYETEYINIFGDIDTSFIDTLLTTLHGSKTVIKPLDTETQPILMLCKYLHYICYNKMLAIKNLYALKDTHSPIEKIESVENNKENNVSITGNESTNNLEKIYPYNSENPKNENENIITNTNSHTNAVTENTLQEKTNTDFNIDTIKTNIDFSKNEAYIYDCLFLFVTLVTVNVYEN